MSKKHQCTACGKETGAYPYGSPPASYSPKCVGTPTGNHIWVEK